ncbi:MAG: hypothetical protein V4482_03985 [Pseudomonadota bacterium]
MKFILCFLMLVTTANLGHSMMRSLLNNHRFIAASMVMASQLTPKRSFCQCSPDALSHVPSGILARFSPESTRYFKGRTANTLILVNMRGKIQDVETGVYDQDNEKERLIYCTPFDCAVVYKTLGDFTSSLGMLALSSNFQALSIFVIPQGSPIECVMGLAAPQSTTKDDVRVRRQAAALNVLPETLCESLTGGGSLIALLSAPDAIVYDVGCFTKSRYVSRSGIDGNGLFLNPLHVNSERARRENVVSHLVELNRWKSEELPLVKLFGGVVGESVSPPTKP